MEEEAAVEAKRQIDEEDRQVAMKEAVEFQRL